MIRYSDPMCLCGCFVILREKNDRKIKPTQLLYGFISEIVAIIQLFLVIISS